MTIERDGYHVSGEDPNDDNDPPFVVTDPGDRYTFAIGGKQVHGSESTETEARATAAFLSAWHHRATVTILCDGKPIG